MKTGFVSAILMGAFSITASESRWVEVDRQVHLMGTVATLTTYAPNRLAGLEQLETFLRILEDAEQELSTWRPDSVLSRLNRHLVGSPFAISNHLSPLFEGILFWQRETGGAFDPAIGSLIEAWGVHDGGRRPEAEELEAARYRSGLDHLRFDARARQLIKDREITIDVGGFGKGEALDRVAEHARQNQSKPFLIDLGGQIMVHGVPPHQKAWRVDVAHPIDRDRPVLSLQLKSGSISTSGGSERDFHVDGDRIGHILDPRTGLPVVSNISVSVWHERALVADILSTALYVMGPDKALAWAQARHILACFLLPSANGKVEIRATREWSRLTQKPFLNR